MKKINLFLTSVALISLPYLAEADLRFPIHPEQPIERELPPYEERLCKPNRDETQIIVTREHLKAIKEAVHCGDLEHAQNIALGLAEFLNDQQNSTPTGICYDDRKCKVASANNATTKAMCKAANGKSWSQTSPTQGGCELIR